MRPCLFQIMIDSKEPSYPGSKFFKKEWCQPRKGTFLTWGIEGDGEGGSQTTAIVEDEEGRVHEVTPSRMGFTDRGIK